MDNSRHRFALSRRLVVAFVLLAVCTAVPASAGRFFVQYVQPPAELEELIVVFRDEQIFTTITDIVNDTIRLPHDVPITFDSCGEANAFYNWEYKEIIMCYELVAEMVAIFANEPGASDEEIGGAIIGSTTFFMLHEMGHALVNVLDLPITGREEDAVDDLASLILIAGEAHDALLGAADSFEAFAASMSDRTSELPFWDEHSLSAQRSFAIACLVYGSEPEAYAALAHPDLLPPERAARCPREFDQKWRAWDRLLAPYAP